MCELPCIKVVVALPSLYSDEGHEMLPGTLITIKALVVVVNVWSENLIPSVNVFEVVILNTDPSRERNPKKFL